MAQLTKKALDRYKQIEALAAKHGPITIRQIQRMWGISYAAVSSQLHWFNSHGYSTKHIVRREPRRRAGVPNDNGEQVIPCVEVEALGDAKLPECPACKAAGRVGFGGETVHLVKDAMGFVYCEACAYTLPFVALEDKPARFILINDL